MIRIPQHRSDMSLNDIRRFIPFIEALSDPLEWEISVEWCSGDGAYEIERSAETPWRGNHAQFVEIYKGIFQTIDGQFSVQTDKGGISLIAVDSSYWDIQSDNDSLEDAFEKEYGRYISPFD